MTYSIGLARTKVLAKQASKLEKPNGMVMLLTKEEEIKALKKTPIDNIWGIGRHTVPELNKLGIMTSVDFILGFPTKQFIRTREPSSSNP